MERTKFTESGVELSPSYSTHEEPLVISKPLMDILLTEKNPSCLIALYCFYYYTAKWQKTNRPKATDKYCMSGLTIGYDKFHAAQKKLISLGLIEKVHERDKSGKYIGWYMKVNFIWGKEKATQIIQNSQNTVLDKKPELLKTSTGFQNTNALSTIKENALSSLSPSLDLKKIPPKKQRALKYLPLAQKLSSIVLSVKNMTHTTRQLQGWSYSICQLSEDNEISYERIEKALTWYEKNIGGQYIPVIESGASLKDKFMKLESAMSRGKPKTNGKAVKIMEDGTWFYLTDAGHYKSKAGILL